MLRGSHIGTIQHTMLESTNFAIAWPSGLEIRTQVIIVKLCANCSSLFPTRQSISLQSMRSELAGLCYYVRLMYLGGTSPLPVYAGVGRIEEQGLESMLQQLVRLGNTLQGWVPPSGERSPKMARIVLGLATSHSPQLSLPAENWLQRGEEDQRNPEPVSGAQRETRQL